MSEHQVEIRRVNKDDYNRVVNMFPPGELYSGIDYIPDYFHMLIGMSNVEAYAAIIDNKFVEIRRVNKDDYNRVVNMFLPGELYSGIDYIPDYFHMLIGMSNVEAYAAIIDNKFVSFLLITILDDGKTRVGRAGRTLKKYEGHGLNQRLMQYFETVSTQRYSNVYHASVGIKEDKAVQRRIETGRRCKVLQKDFHTYTGTSTAEFSNKLHNNVILKSSAKLMNETDLCQIFCNQAMCRQFFPEGRLIVDWVPYRLINPNAALIKMERTTVVGSNLHSLEHALLTFVSLYRAHVGLVWILDVYGHINSILNEHLLLHYKNIPLDKIPQNIFIRCFCSDNTKWNLISSIMNELGLRKRQDFRSGIICSERILTDSSKL